MLCFLPPPPACLPPLPAADPRRPSARAAAIIVLIALCVAVLAPFGWSYVEPQYDAQVGIPLQLVPREEDLAIRAALASRHLAGFVGRFRAGAHASVPPGLAVDGATGILSGTPSMAGTYTLALAVEDGPAVVSGRSFRLKVLPPAH